MCIFDWLKKMAAPEKSAAPKNPPEKAAPVKKDVRAFTEMRHQAGTGDPKLKGKHHTGSF